MCGFFGSIAPFGEEPALTEVEARRMLDALAHRGPDGSGLHRAPGVVLGHTRLAVRDLGSPGAAQPIATPCGGFVLVYNGEVYNDAELRSWLEPDVLRRTEGRGFATDCDAETVLWALALHGEAALERIVGMYALGFHDVAGRSLLLARDPLGVKPLVWSRLEGAGHRGLAFASEPKALLRHPGMVCEPDPVGIGAYFISSRRTLHGRTLFRGVKSVEPGATYRIDLSEAELEPRRLRGLHAFERPVVGSSEFDPDGAVRACREEVERVIRSQLVSDVPVCALLSGGLDSAILTRTAALERRRVGAEPLGTWCASGYEHGAEIGDDPPAARAFAQEIGSRHRDVHVDREAYLREWRNHVQYLGAPLSTPNEVAIAETARAIRDSGATVTLSGEGADELFGGYEATLAAFHAHEAMEDPPLDAARFHLELSSWVSPAALGQVLRGAAGEGAAEVCVAEHDAAFQRAREAAGPEACDSDVHLRLQRINNLTPLLERLDAATMRYSVEGRTPFADQRLLALSSSLPMDAKFRAGAAGGAHKTKRILRTAFGPVLPPPIVQRPKASFPLPFERWSAALAAEAAESPFVQEYVTPEALTALRTRPEASWKLAWLVGNLALFGEAAFGVQGRRSAA